MFTLILVGIIVVIGLVVALLTKGKTGVAGTNRPNTNTPPQPPTPGTPPPPVQAKPTDVNWRNPNKWPKHLRCMFWTFVGCVIFLLMLSATWNTWAKAILTSKSGTLMLCWIIATSVLWPFNKKLAWVTVLPALCLFFYAINTEDGKVPFRMPAPSLPSFSSPAATNSPAPQEVLPDKYGNFDFTAPPKKDDVRNPDGWSDEFDVRGEREKLSNGTFRYTHEERCGKYRLEWGRYDRSQRVEVMFDGNPKRIFVIPANQSAPANTVRFRGLDGEEKVRMFAEWVKIKSAK